MHPKSEPKQVERELFQSELEQIIDLRYPLVRLRTSIDWASFEVALGVTTQPRGRGTRGKKQPKSTTFRNSTEDQKCERL